MRKWNRTVAEEGNVDAMARLREQDDRFCQMLRAAVEKGRVLYHRCEHGARHTATHRGVYAGVKTGF